MLFFVDWLQRTYMTSSSVLGGRFLANEIHAFLTSLFVWAVASLVHCGTDLLLLCFLVKGNQVSGISIPLLILLGCSLLWISSFSLCVVQWAGSRSITNNKQPALHEVESHRFYSVTAFLRQADYWLFLVLQLDCQEIYVVYFLFQVIFVFLLFWCMVMYANAAETKEK